MTHGIGGASEDRDETGTQVALTLHAAIKEQLGARAAAERGGWRARRSARKDSRRLFDLLVDAIRALNLPEPEARSIVLAGYEAARADDALFASGETLDAVSEDAWLHIVESLEAEGALRPSDIMAAQVELSGALNSELRKRLEDDAHHDALSQDLLALGEELYESSRSLLEQERAANDATEIAEQRVLDSLTESSRAYLWATTLRTHSSATHRDTFATFHMGAAAGTLNCAIALVHGEADSPWHVSIGATTRIRPFVNRMRLVMTWWLAEKTPLDERDSTAVVETVNFRKAVCLECVELFFDDPVEADEAQGFLSFIWGEMGYVEEDLGARAEWISSLRSLAPGIVAQAASYALNALPLEAQPDVFGWSGSARCRRFMRRWDQLGEFNDPDLWGVLVPNVVAGWTLNMGVAIAEDVINRIGEVGFWAVADEWVAELEASPFWESGPAAPDS